MSRVRIASPAPTLHFPRFAIDSSESGWQCFLTGFSYLRGMGVGKLGNDPNVKRLMDSDGPIVPVSKIPDGNLLFFPGEVPAEIEDVRKNPNRRATFEHRRNEVTEIVGIFNHSRSSAAIFDSQLGQMVDCRLSGELKWSAHGEPRWRLRCPQKQVRRWQSWSGWSSTNIGQWWADDSAGARWKIDQTKHRHCLIRWMNLTPHIEEEINGNVLEVDLHGKLTHEDYERFVPETDRLISRHGKIRLLVVMHDFHGWNAGAVLDAIQWNHRHFRQIERLAIAGDETLEGGDACGAFDLTFSRKLHWQKWLTKFCRRFTSAQVRYFTLDHLDEAQEWLNAKV